MDDVYERCVEELVTKFLLDTCRLHPQFTRPAIEAALNWAMLSSVKASKNKQGDIIPLTTGSIAEFYIEPMLPHIGDIDTMFHWSTELAIPRGHPPPTQLPAEFHNSVNVCEITDTYLPGYVYLKLRYLLTECVDAGKYNAVQYGSHWYFLNDYEHEFTGDKSRIHGPAAMFTVPAPLLSVDAVRCVRCLVWPLQAADWPTRHRNHGWPDSATVDRVVSNGCDVVGVAHRQWKHTSKYQHRLSFSRAEIVLINSWLPVQQIVYHVLRVFMKTVRLTESADNSEESTLSNYHIKTLMLWACELRSRTWWTNEFNIVRICVQLLHTLSDWVSVARCQHYFINNCNLIDSSFNVANISGQLMSVDETWLCTWFVGSYIQRCSQLCPDSISRLFRDVSTLMKLEEAVSAVVAWRHSSQLDLWSV